jgi:hypothetical protein
VVAACLYGKRKVNKKNTQSSKNKFNTLSFALRFRPGRYYNREELIALTELSQSKCSCGNRCSKAKPPLGAAVTLRFCHAFLSCNLEHRGSGELKFLCQHTVEFKFEFRGSVARTGVERARDTKSGVSTGSPGGFITQSGASYSEPFSSPRVLFRCSRHPAPHSSDLRFAADLPWIARVCHALFAYLVVFPIGLTFY